MATTTFPNTSGVKRGRWLVGGIVIIISMIIAALVINSLSRRSAVQAPAMTTVASGTIIAAVAGSGTIAAVQSLDLPFKTNGTVTEVLVTEGDTLTSGQAIARLDARDLQLQVENAQAGLASAQARLNQTKEGNATPEDITAAKASVASAQANVISTRTGSVTAADIASAAASLRSAQAKLDALKNPSPDKISSAQLQVTQAQNALQSTRNSASATKTKAELDLKKAVESLTQAQSSYGTALEEWKHVQNTGTDPINPTTTNAQGGATDNKVNGAQAQQYYDSYVRAESSMRSAEQAVAQAQVTYDNARQQEVVDVQDAEAKLADAQQQLDALKNPSQSDIVQAQAAVDQAAASLKKSKQGGSAAEVAAAQANVTQNQANLDKLTAPATATDIEIQQAAVAQAEQSLKQAQLNLEQATLSAPFNGIVTSVTIVPGSSGSSATPAVTLIDRSTLHVDLKLSENDVAQVQLGQKVDLAVDALDGWKAQGTVSYIAPSAETSNGVVTYVVRVSFPDSDARVKVGMTSDLTITTAQKDNVLLVPASALLPKGAGRVVQVLNTDGTTTREVDVQTGLTDDANVEITSGLSAGDKVVTTPSTTTAKTGGLFGR